MAEETEAMLDGWKDDREKRERPRGALPYPEGTKLLRLDEGPNLIRLLAPIRKGDRPYRRLLIHYDAGPQREQVRCLQNWDEPCPLCGRAQEFRQRGDEASLKTAKDIGNSPRFLWNAVKDWTDRAGKRHRAVGVLMLSKLAQDGIERVVFGYKPSEDDDPEFRVSGEVKAHGDITDPVKGYDIRIQNNGADVKAGKKKIIEYYVVTPRAKPTTLFGLTDKEQLKEAVLKTYRMRADLDALIRYEKPDAKAVAQMAKATFGRARGGQGGAAPDAGAALMGAGDGFDKVDSAELFGGGTGDDINY